MLDRGQLTQSFQGLPVHGSNSRLKPETQDEFSTIFKGLFPNLPPFVVWTVPDGQVRVCSRCCRSLKNGFTADLIEAVAIADINRLYNCHEYTLERRMLTVDYRAPKPRIIVDAKSSA
jgi:hypothetical protein